MLQVSIAFLCKSGQSKYLTFELCLNSISVAALLGIHNRQTARQHNQHEQMPHEADENLM
jgi:hypothetical protein